MNGSSDSCGALISGLLVGAAGFAGAGAGAAFVGEGAAGAAATGAGAGAAGILRSGCWFVGVVLQCRPLLRRGWRVNLVKL